MSQKSSSNLNLPLSGWGRYPLVKSHLQRPEKISYFTDIIEEFTGEAILARGAGRSYGDAALNPECTVLTERLNRMLAFDGQTGILYCEAGVTIQEILEVFVPRGGFQRSPQGRNLLLWVAQLLLTFTVKITIRIVLFLATYAE